MKYARWNAAASSLSPASRARGARGAPAAAGRARARDSYSCPPGGRAASRPGNIIFYAENILKEQPFCFRNPKNWRQIEQFGIVPTKV